MINDLIITTLVSGLETEVGETSDYDEDRVALISDEPIRDTDPNLTIGIRDGDIVPVDYEIGQLDAAHYRYSFEIQCFIKSTSKSEGYTLSRKIVKRVRKALFVSGVGSLSGKLLALEDDEDGIIERVSKFKLMRIAPHRERVETGFMFLSVLTLQFETESIFA